MSTFHPAQLDPFIISGAGAIAGATTVTLKSFTTIDGVALAMSDFGSIGYATIEPGNGTQEEQVSFSGVVQNSNGTATLSGIKSVLFLTPYTESSGLAKTHAGSTSFVISNTAGFYNQYPAKANNETISGQWTFTNTPITPPSVSLASTTVAGIVQEATNAQVLAKTQTGGTGADLFVTPNNFASTLLSDYKADTGAADAYVITPLPAITAYTAGQIFSFKAAHTNTGTSTLAVSGLSAQTIKTTSGSNLTGGTIVTGQLVVVEYDGTNFQMVSQSATEPFVSKFSGTGADGALSITSGTTTINLGSAAIVEKNYTSISITGTGVLGFSSPNSAGTIVILKSQGDVTITSSATPCVDLRAMGSAGGVADTSGTTPTGLVFTATNSRGLTGSGATGGVAGSSLAGSVYTTSSDHLFRKAIFVVAGAGGGGGQTGDGGAPGAGGRGGGTLIIQAAGALNFTGVINASGAVGADATVAGGSSAGSGAGGGGGAGQVVILYGSLSANAGTITTTGGNGGTGGTGAGSTGASGGGGSGAGSTSAAGGTGANGGAAPAAGGNAGGVGAGAGGGGGLDGTGAGSAGGTGGASASGLVAQNVDFT